MTVGSVLTILPDMRAAFRQSILAGPYPSVTFTTQVSASGFVLSAPSEPGLDFRALGFRGGDFVVLSGFAAKANGGLRRLVKVTATELTFFDKLTTESKPSGVRVAVVITSDRTQPPSAGIPVAWEAEGFTPTKGSPFLQEVVQGAGSVVAALGRGSLQRHKVLATATLFWPSGQGTLGLESMAGRLLAQFMPGTGLVYGSSQGIVTQAEARPLLQEPEWISCPVIVTVTAWTTN